MSEARRDILARIGRAVGGVRGEADEEYAAISRSYQQESGLGRDALVDLFASRIVHYDGSVLRCTAVELPATIAKALTARGKPGLHVPAGIDRNWLPQGVGFIADTDAPAAELDASPGVLTACTVAVATTGTIVLTHAAGEGRRALTLVPDYHLSVVFADQIVESVPEAMRRVAGLAPSLVTTVSGPSATSDIEMTRIKGVHGPRVLDVVIVS